jgi:ankyrin repeat protein
MAIYFNSRDILWACRQGDIHLVKFLIMRGENPFKETKDDNNNYIIPIDFYGISNRNITEVEKNNHIKKIKKFMFKYKILRACKQGDISLVKILIKKGFNPLKKLKIGYNHYIIPIEFYGSSNRNITEVGKNNHIKKIKKFMFKYEFTKGIEEIFFASDIERLLSPQITA